MKTNSAFWTKSIAGLVALGGMFLPLTGAPVPTGADSGSGERTMVAEVSGNMARQVPTGGEWAKASPQFVYQRSIAEHNLKRGRGGAREETFNLIVFPFFVILFTGACVCLYLGAIAWMPGSCGDEMAGAQSKEIEPRKCHGNA